MAAAEVDLGYLASHLGMPEVNLTTVATDPTADLVRAILSAVATKGYEYDSLFTQKLQLEVELETSVRSAEAQRDASNETAKKALKEVEELRQKLKVEETTRQTLENELQSIKSSSSTSHSEIDSLRARIASLETSNRESLAIIDTKNSANDTLSQQLQAQHQKTLKLNQEVTALQQSVQNANNAASSAKFREQSLQQQLQMAQNSCDFFDKELKTKSAEALKYRKEKGARITELQRLNDDATSNIESLKRTEQQLRQRLDEAQKKADDALTRIQQLQEAVGRKEEDFRQESDSLRRLVDLKEQQTLTHKKRVQEVEAREEQVKRECEDSVRRISEELARANSDKEELSQAIETLRDEVGRLEAMVAGGSPAQFGSAPQTPRPMNGSTYRTGSPFATPASTRKNLSTTQLMEDFYRVKGQLNAEKLRSSSLAKELDDVIDQLEAKRPELEELQADNERLQQEMKTMSQLSDESFRERDVAKKAARRAEASAAEAEKRSTLLQYEVKSLSAQIQMLTFNVHCLEKGLDQLTVDERLVLQRLERGQIIEQTGEEELNAHTSILERLVVFKNIKELQERNEQLLQVTHDLAERMENEEAIAAKSQALEDHKERVRLEQEMEVFRDTLRSFQVKTESITKERDMFRRIVESRASADEMASALGRSTQDGVFASIEQNATAIDDTSDYTTLLRELQQNFDHYRTEQTADRKTMKEQLEKLSAERNSLQGDVSKLQSQLSLATERYEILQSNFAALQSENRELAKRNQTMSESAAKQDIRTQQVAEDLVEARGLLESMRSENANLKAEKNLWKDIQERLGQDNESLTQERSRLNGLIATQQTLQNERELSESETKRRLQSQIDSLEIDLNTTKRKLADEVEEGKKTQLRKEYDAQQFQKRIDELTGNLSQIREDLVATKTGRDHLQSRVDELTIQLRSAEERAERLQPRPTPRPGTNNAAASELSTTQVDTDERIQDLIHEVTDLKRDLEMTKSHLENAQAQAEQYKEMSQASEEELEKINSTQEQYQQEMDASISAKDTTIKELEQRVEDLSTELARSNSELSTLRDSQAETAKQFEDEKAILNDEIKRLKDEEERYTASSQFHQQDLRAQAEIAANAQQAYESEVMKHGETAKSLSSLRGEYNQIKTSAATWKAEAESAKATLLQNESSWDERRQRFEREISELRARRDDANAQNKLLHQQLEGVSKQVSALQQSRSSTGESLDSIAAQPSSSDTDKFRELSNYLRREKDILEVQYDLKEQEAKRLQQQLEYAQSQLDEARLKLEQERRSQSDNDRSSMAHKDLMSKLEELNLFRESSAALRAEARQAQSQLAEKIARISELEGTIQPLEAQIEELQSQQAFKEAEMKQLHEDRDRWQKRTEDILSKHGRTDPAEVEELKQTVAKLESERDALQTAETPLKQRIEELENNLNDKEAAWQVTREKLITSAKERSRNLTNAKNEVVAERDQLQTRLGEVSGQLSTTQAELEASKEARLGLEEQINNFKLQVEALQEEAQKNSTISAPSDSSDTQALSTLQAQLAEVRAELDNVSSQKAAVERDLQNARDQLNWTIAERDQALASIETRITNGDAAMENGADASEERPLAALLSDDERKALEEKIAEAAARAAEWEVKAKEESANHDQIVKTRSDKMKESLNKRLAENKTQMEEERAQMKKDMEKLEADFKLRLEQERKIWEAENANGPSDTKPPATPARPQPSETPGGTPMTDFTGLNDKEIRDLVSTNPTIKSIIQNNIKNKLAIETKKVREEQQEAMKAEWEQRVAKARDQATQLAASKSNLKLNMSERKVLAATAKLTVVEKAAQETPQRAVGEVWEIAKVAKPSTPRPEPSTESPATPAPGLAATTPATRVTATSASTNALETKPISTSGIPKNPFTKQELPQSLPANPFAPTGQPPALQPGSNLPPVPTQPSMGSQIPKAATSLPVPSAGVRRGSGPNQGRGGGRGGPANRGNRGNRGNMQGGRASLNPSADNFQPGEKRPRGDSDLGNGAKRPRGGPPH